MAIVALVAAWSGSTVGGVILGGSVIGTYRVKKDGSLAGATAAFGTPASKVLRSGACYVNWPSRHRGTCCRHPQVLPALEIPAGGD